MWFLRQLSRLPLPVLYTLSRVLFIVTYYGLQYRRKVIRENLKRAFPGYPPEEIHLIEKNFYHHLCNYGVETLKLLTLSKEELTHRMRFRNAGILQGHQQRNETVVLLASHQFNWEWLLAAGSLVLPLPVDFVYQPQSSKLFNAFSLACRTRFGAHPIERKEVAREAIRRRAHARAIAIVADQFPSRKRDKRYWTTFLHQETAFFQGIGQLVHMLQAPTYYAALHQVKRGYYEVELQPLSQPPYAPGENATVEAYVQATERMIRTAPASWLWSHKRWKRTRAEMGD